MDRRSCKLPPSGRSAAEALTDIPAAGRLIERPEAASDLLKARPGNRRRADCRARQRSEQPSYGQDQLTGDPGEAGRRALPTNPEALLYDSEMAQLCAISSRTPAKWRLQGYGPPFIRLGRRCVRYRLRDVLDWIESCSRRSTSDPGQGS